MAVMVKVRRQWNSWRIGETEIENLSGIHWDQVSGGVARRAPRPFLHGYVSCDKIASEIDHSCAHGEGPHCIKVCIVKKDNSKSVIDTLLKMEARCM